MKGNIKGKCQHYFICFFFFYFMVQDQEVGAAACRSEPSLAPLLNKYYTFCELQQKNFTGEDLFSKFISFILNYETHETL